MSWGLLSIPLSAGLMQSILNATRTLAMRTALAAGLWDSGYRYLIHPSETAAGLTDANLTFGFDVGQVERYGADPTGAADSAPAFVNAFKVTGRIKAAGTYKINSGLTLDISTTSLEGPCTLVSGLAANAGALITVTGSNGPDANTIHGLDQVQFLGTNLAGVQALVFTTAGYAAGDTTVNRCNFFKFATCVWIKTNAWEVEFSRCSFANSGADNAALYITFAGSERSSCVQCAFYNCTECIRQSSGGQLFLDNCSLDYSNRCVVCTFGQVFMSHCYIENNLDTDYWLNATGANPASLIKFDDGMISQTAAKPNYCIGNSSAGYGGGIYLRNSKLYTNNNTVKSPIIDGTGPALMAGCIVEGFANNYYAWSGASQASNLLSNGTFANGLNGWTYGSDTGSGGNPTVAANTLTLQPAVAGQEQHAYWVVNVAPGDNLGMQCQAKVNNASATFGMHIDIVGADGTVLASSQEVPGYNIFGPANPLPTAAYQVVKAAFLNCPAGAATARIRVDTAGASSNAYAVSVQSVTASKY